MIPARMPESMRFFCVRVDRDEETILELEREVIAFLKEVREKINELQRVYDPQPIDAAAAFHAKRQTTAIAESQSAAVGASRTHRFVHRKGIRVTRTPAGL